ncbi:hypothetical protein [Tautonia sociabilis]|nr:hypothetical protein [Tautonia sociabilis]
MITRQTVLRNLLALALLLVPVADTFAGIVVSFTMPAANTLP